LASTARIDCRIAAGVTKFGKNQGLEMDEKAPIRTAVITGTGGIALGVAKRLLRDGFSVILCGNDPEQNELVRSELTG